VCICLQQGQESPFLLPLFLSVAFFFFFLAFRSRVSHESLHRSSSRASDFFSLSRACPVAARAVRPSAHNTPLGCVWYYCHCQLVVASGASGRTFSRLFLSLSRHHILPWSLWANCRKTIYCMQASSETIDSSWVWESQNLWEELVELNPIYISPCCRCFAFRRWVVD
jgi:hypothetical protein